MKELSIEEKAKHYDEAIKKVNDYCEGKTKLYSDVDKTLNYLFPELKESEDERIRKVLIENFKFYGGDFLETSKWGKDNDLLVTDIIAWLEKQGGQKPSDKVEPKFHEGDWVILAAGELSTTLQIVNVDTNKKLYWFNDNSYLPIVDEECLHLFTIEDAKDGDVLYSLDSNRPFIYKVRNDYEQAVAYCGLNIYGKFFVWNTKVSNYVPATKEQRDLLFQKMKEAGYEWDAEHKQLKKIYEENNEYVDLGLPSGTLWKNSNEEGLLDYDTALGKYGDSLPTKEELEELKEQCKWEWTGKGYNVIGKNGNSIYLPAAGWCDSHGKLHLVDSDGFYWSSTPYCSVCVWRLSLDSSGVYMYHNDRSYDQSVRLVKRNNK